MLPVVLLFVSCIGNSALLTVIVLLQLMQR
jgi:hypothetical protein